MSTSFASIHTINVTLYFCNLSGTPYSSLFVRIRFYVPPLCRVQSTAFNIFTHGLQGLLSVYRGAIITSDRINK